MVLFVSPNHLALVLSLSHTRQPLIIKIFHAYFPRKNISYVISWKPLQNFICFTPADVRILFEGSPSISDSQRDNKAASACPWTLGEETSCFYSTLYARNCQVTGTCSWKKNQVFRYRPSSAKEVHSCKASGNLFKDIACRSLCTCIGIGNWSLSTQVAHFSFSFSGTW